VSLQVSAQCRDHHGAMDWSYHVLDHSLDQVGAQNTHCLTLPSRTDDPSDRLARSGEQRVGRGRQSSRTDDHHRALTTAVLH
jgi:hypothetical protein